MLREFESSWSDEEDEGGAKHQIVQCKGCEFVRFRVQEWNGREIDGDSGEPKLTVHVYPEYAFTRREAAIDVDFETSLPAIVERIYRETVTALNSGTLILAGAGLRAIVEAICTNANVPHGNLQSKIDALVKQNLLAQPQADLLHEERYLGNAAIHEIEPPSRRDVEDGLTIVETLLNTMFVAAATAQRLRDRRLRKAAEKAANPPLAILKPEGK